jgi:hypothetical protein
MNITYLKEALEYNAQNGVFVWKNRPRHHFNSDRAWWQWNGRYAGSLAGTTYKPNKKFDYLRVKIVINNKMHFAHQLAWQMSFGEIPNGLFVDHVDGDATNNAIANLRLVTHAENHRNRGVPINNTSGEVGIRRCGNKWQARIKVNQKEISLGTYQTFEEAVAARRSAAEKHGFTNRHFANRT